MLEKTKEELRRRLSPENQISLHENLFYIDCELGEFETVKKKLDVMEHYLLLLTRHFIKTNKITIDEAIEIIEDSELV